MIKKLPFITILVFVSIAQSCSKKTQPTATPPTTSKVEKIISVPDTVVVTPKADTLVIKKVDSSIVEKPAVKKKAKEPIPKVIVVNDKYAKRSVDGRYYYDLQGHRYWRSNKDGKYYLFNKSMLTDDEFKKPD